MGFVVGLQAMCALVVVAMAAFFGKIVVWSAMAGALTALLPSLFFLIFLKMTSKPSAVRFFIGEAFKILVMVVLFLLVWRNGVFQVDVVAYWLALVAVLMVQNLSLLRKAR